MASVKIIQRKEQKSDGLYPLAIRITKDRKSSYIYLVSTLKDLISINTMVLLGVKINQLLKYVIFNDSSIELQALITAGRKNYLQMKDPNEWARYKKKKTSTHRHREKKLQDIVTKYGKNNAQDDLQSLIKKKRLN